MPKLHMGKPGHAKLTLQMLDAVRGVAAGESQREIAVRMGISQPRVNAILKRAHAALDLEIRQTLNQHRAAQVQSYQWIFQEFAAAWKQSKKPSKRVVQTMNRVKGADGQWIETPVSQRVEVEESPGDPSYLAGCMNALAGIARLLGLNAPVTTATPKEPTLEEQLTDAELLAQMHEEYEQMAARVGQAALPEEIP